MQIGSVRLEPVVELDHFSFPAEGFFDVTDHDYMRAHAHEVPANCFDPVSGMLSLSQHSWLVDTGRHKIIIDPCIGNGKPHIYSVYANLDTPYLDRLRALGCEPEDVDFVFCTHLHFDHCGWNTRLEDGRWTPTFPNARYLLPRIECEFWHEHAHDLSQHAYQVNEGVYDRSIKPVVEAALATLIDPGHEFAGCMTVEDGRGHTPGHMYGVLDAGEGGVVFAGDVIHHAFEILRPDWNSSVCMDPVEARATRRRVLELCDQRLWLLAAAHLTAPRLMHVWKNAETNGYCCRPVSESAYVTPGVTVRSAMNRAEEHRSGSSERKVER